MRIARQDLRLDRLVVIYPGDRRYELADAVSVLPDAALADPKQGALFGTRRPGSRG